MQELINSFVRLSAVMTVYSMQQMQSAVETVDPKESVTRLRQMIDSMTNALTAQIDESRKATVESMTSMGSGVVEKTFETLHSANLDPREIVNVTSDIVKKTTDSLAGMMNLGEEKKTAPASEPVAAGEVLASH